MQYIYIYIYTVPKQCWYLYLATQMTKGTVKITMTLLQCVVDFESQRRNWPNLALEAALNT